METAILIIILLIILLLITQFNIKIKIKYDVIENRGSVVVKLFKSINIINYNFQIKRGFIKASTKNGKYKLFPIDLTTEGLQQYADLNTLIFDKTTLNKGIIFFNFGVKNEPYLTAMASSVLEIFSSIFFAVLKNKKSNFVIDKKIYTNFLKSQIKFGFKADANISIFDTFWCLAQSKFIFAKTELKKS